MDNKLNQPISMLGDYWDKVQAHALAEDGCYHTPAASDVACASNPMHNFSYALEAIRQGYTAWREGWNGKGLRIQLQFPTFESKMTLPYIYLSYPPDAKNTPGAKVPWLASQTDLLAEDWRVQKTLDSL